MQTIGADSQIIQILWLIDKGFKIATINMFTKIKEKMEKNI